MKTPVKFANAAAAKAGSFASDDQKRHGVVLSLATFAVLYLGIGFQLTLQSIMIIPVAKMYSTDLWQSALALSIFHLAFAITYWVTPLTSRLGLRNVTIASGLLVTFGRAVITLCPSLPFLYPASICAGIGTIFLHYNAIILLNYHYKYSENLSVAMGFALCGQPVAIMTTPFILYWLQKHIGWTGASLTCGASSFVLVLVALILKPHEEKATSAPPDLSSIIQTPRARSRLQPNESCNSACNNFIGKMTTTANPREERNSSDDEDSTNPDDLKAALESLENLPPQIFVTTAPVPSEIVVQNDGATQNSPQFSCIHTRVTEAVKSSAGETIYEEEEDNYSSKSMSENSGSLNSSDDERQKSDLSYTAPDGNLETKNEHQIDTSYENPENYPSMNVVTSANQEWTDNNDDTENCKTSDGSSAMSNKSLGSKSEENISTMLPILTTTNNSNNQSNSSLDHQNQYQFQNGNKNTINNSDPGRRRGLLSVSFDQFGGSEISMHRSRSYEDSFKSSNPRLSTLEVPNQVTVKRVRSADDVQDRMKLFQKNQSSKKSGGRGYGKRAQARRETLAFVIKASGLTAERRETLANIATKPFQSNRRDSVRAFSGVTVPEILVAATFRGMWIKTSSGLHEIQAQKLEWLRQKTVKRERKVALKNPRIWVYGLITFLLRAAFAMILVYIPTKQLILSDDVISIGMFSTMFCLGLGALTGRILLGMLADWEHCDRVVLNFGCCLLAGLISIARGSLQLGVDHEMLQRVLSLSVAFLSATSFLLYSVHVIEIIPGNQQEHVTFILRIMDTFQALGYVIGPVIAGACFTNLENDHWILSLTGIFLSTGAFLLLLVSKWMPPVDPQSMKSESEQEESQNDDPDPNFENPNEIIGIPNDIQDPK